MAEHASVRSDPPAPFVAILMSTHNGARFLAPQIESILAQTWTGLRLVVRDDGSTDGTVQLLQELVPPERGTVVTGPGVGAAESFLALLYELAGDADYVGFADQDDVWLPEKVARAVGRLAAFGEEPALYCARARVVDHALQPLGETPLWPHAPRFGNALVENIAMGCTVVLNRAAVRLITRVPRPEHAVMHDWWCYLVVSALGHVIFDSEPALLYRQHPSNAVGVTTSSAVRILHKLRRQLRQDSLGLLVGQACDFTERYRGALPLAQAELLDSFIAARSLAQRLSFARDRRLFRQFPLDDALLRLRLLAG